MVKSFKTLITEQKNVHMEHIEDILFDEGVAGARRAINFMQGMRDMLAGKSSNKVNATVKKYPFSGAKVRANNMVYMLNLLHAKH